MLPPDPVSHLIDPEARLALRSLKTLFDAVFRIGHAGELFNRCVDIRFREIIVVFICPVRLLLAGDNYNLLRTRAPRSVCGLGRGSE